jgi:glutamate racemase
MIGVFDSGIGGLSVLRELRRRIPGGEFLYFGDTAGGPYENKSPGFMAARMAKGLSFLADSGAGLLVVADHGAACLVPEVRDRLSVPVLDILNNGVVPGVKALSPKALGIMGPSVIESTGAYEEALRQALPEIRMYTATAPLLSPLIEAGWLKKPETAMILKKYLHFFKLRQIDTLIMGSNHYSILASVIERKIGKRVRVLSAGPVLAREVGKTVGMDVTVEKEAVAAAACRVMVSDLTDATARGARMFYGKNIRLESLPSSSNLF